ncbi:hypothetical protein FRC98_10755 [Lujinxingia vulgaris]|uniref:Uncharacterized protein n=1 Tax=Lujinxingia vulgaris TaxID=2600176 RepID=A0A5C6XI52_9DELT|nr:hypothetical protein [Lujinxingia vulgaris]TXD37205.1 hypothetical protein FRC98_10755 [Lujinxingia vulgaris]
MKAMMWKVVCVALVCGVGAAGCAGDAEDPSDVGQLQDGGGDAGEDASEDANAPDVADEPDADAPDADAPDADAPDAEEPDADAPDVDETPEGDGTSCEQAIDVSEGVVLEDQTTVGAPENQDADGDGCPSGRISGPELIYVVSPSEPTSYRVRVEPNEVSFDPMIYVRSGCETSVCLAGTVLNGPGSPETLSFEAPGGVPSYIFVDGEWLSEGSFRLEVTIEE